MQTVCSTCGKQLRQVAEIKIGAVILRRSDGLTGAGTPPMLCQSCIKVAYTADTLPAWIERIQS